LYVASFSLWFSFDGKPFHSQWTNFRGSNQLYGRRERSAYRKPEYFPIEAPNDGPALTNRILLSGSGYDNTVYMKQGR
jgi:hypothetical protein